MSSEFDISNITFPDKMVSSASVARHIVDGIQSSHESYWETVKKMEEHINGKKPKDPVKLRKQGLAWSNNWNRGKARAKIEKGTAENVKAVNDSLALASVSFRRFDEKKDKDKAEMQFLLSDEMRGIVATKISTVFGDTFEREPRAVDFLNSIEYTSYTFGWCAITKDKKRDWFGTPHRIREIGFKDKTKPDEIKMYAVFDEIHGDELWRLWTKYSPKATVMKSDEDGNNYHIPESGGYIREGLEEALYHCFYGVTEKNRKDVNITSFEQIVPEFINKPSWCAQNTSKLSLARIYNFELNGDFTVTYVAYGNSWYVNPQNQQRAESAANGQLVSPKYLLYQKRYKGLDQDDVITIVKDSGFTTEGYIQDMRGIGKYAVQDSIRYNRKSNSIEDKLIFSGSPFFEQSNAQSGEVFRISPSQGFVMTSDGFRLIPTQPKFDLSNHLLSMKMDEDDYNRETQHYDAKLGGQLTSRPNKDEVRAKAAEVNRIESSKMDIKLKSYQRLFFNMLKSLSALVKSEDADISKTALDGARYFKEELLEELKDVGVSDEESLFNVLDSITSLSLEPTVGSAEAIKEMLALSETPYARRRLTRMLFLSRGLPRKELNRLYPVITDDFRSYGNERVAAIENDLFWTTKEVVYQDNDDPVKHLDIHYKKIATVFEQIGVMAIDPVKGYQYIANLLEHSIFHLQKLVENPYFQRYFKQYKAYYDGFTKALNALKPKIEEMARAIQQGQQAQSPQIDPQTQAKIEMDWYKTKAGIELNEKRSDFRANEKAKDAEFRRQMQAEDHKIKVNQLEEMNNLKKEKELISASVKLGEALTQQQQPQNG